ncbi:MAG: orotidine 5'-phosphate decarboxylase [Nitrospirae bacterium]|nr:orotidine 5'-phosphate decarboxylase [Nitrospirota bacterium]
MKLQAAIDLLNMDEAIDIARYVGGVGVDLIEVGSPLIKSVGISSIERIKELFPMIPICADMKIADIGFIETGLALYSGASMVTVLSVISDRTITESLRAGSHYGCIIIADLLGEKDMIKRIPQLKSLGIKNIHFNYPLENAKTSDIDFLKRLTNDPDIKFSIAGAINNKNVYKLKGVNVDIVVVGRYITESKTPDKNAYQMMEIIKSF